MSGTRTGGLKAKKANLNTDPNFYQKLGHKGGSVSGADLKNLKGFAQDRQRASTAGKKGGQTSRKPRQAVLESLLPKPKWYQVAYRRQLKRAGVKI